ncbi:unnamed protein product, partial [marine sediment metagenome]
NLGRYVERGKGILATEAVGYLDCVQLESRAKLIMTDSCVFFNNVASYECSIP